MMAQASDGSRLAEEALGVFGALTDANWVTSLDATYLNAKQKLDVREWAYLTVLAWADYCLRFNPNQSESVAKSLDLLRRAERFHEPTRAFYFLRSECERKQGDIAAAREDERRYKQMKGVTACDYFLPGNA